ncbi:MAG: hypothetical protein JOZ93_11045, partial [Sinobacteraceae bacterium]|nr:hypothetical protein [Nevskiaceae bacterium]
MAAVAVWLATAASAVPAAPVAPAASSWSLLPQPADVHLAPSSTVKVSDRALVGVRGTDREQVQPIADRFVQLVANTRGLQLETATMADAHPAITFEMDPRASVVGNTGYRLEIGADGIRILARSP